MDYFCVVIGTTQCDIPLEPLIHLICTQLTNLMRDMHISWKETQDLQLKSTMNVLLLKTIQNVITCMPSLGIYAFCSYSGSVSRSDPDQKSPFRNQGNSDVTGGFGC